MSFTYVIIEAECGMRIHKYIDDITITEQVTNGEVSHLQKSLDSIRDDYIIQKDKTTVRPHHSRRYPIRKCR